MPSERVKQCITVCFFMTVLFSCSGERRPLSASGNSDTSEKNVADDTGESPAAPAPTPPPPVEVFAMTPPQMLGPLNFSFNLRPTFAWNAVTLATRYEVVVRNLTTGSTVYEPRNVLTTNWSPPTNLADGPYRWWVIAIGENNVRGNWSEPLDVKVGGRGVVLAPIGTTMNHRPTFAWQPVEGAVRYELWVDDVTSTRSQVVNETNLATLEYTAATDLANGNYQVWVRAFNAAGEFGVWSTRADFTINGVPPSP